MFDLENQYACRYGQENLQNRTDARPTDLCDWKTGFHYRLNDTNLYSTCDFKTEIGNPITAWQWPDGLSENSKYIGTVPIAQKDCDHFVALNLSSNGIYVQMDVYTANDTGFPCLISVFDLNAKPRTILTWAFDGFTDAIPDEARRCTAPEVVCDKPNWICNAVNGTDQDDLGAALQWVCGPGRVDCDGLNPGGPNFEPNTVFDHCNWAFNMYFQTYKALYGEDACYFGGIAKLGPPQTSNERPVKKYREKKSKLAEHWSLEMDEFVMDHFSLIYPEGLVCGN